MSEEKDPIQALEDAIGCKEEETSKAADEQEAVVEEPEVEEPAAGEDEPELIPKSDLEKEIQGKVKLRQQRRELREENARLKAELESLKGKPEPKLEDFDTVEDFEAAMETHGKVEQGNPAFDVAKSTLIDMAEESAPEDWYEVVSREPKDGGVPFTEEMIILLADFDDGANVMYELAKRPDEYAKIESKLSQAMKIRALERFADSLNAVDDEPATGNRMAAGQTVRKPKVAAIDPVGGGTRGSPKLESMGIEDHIKAVRSGPRW